jgi:hypothetical protein
MTSIIRGNATAIPLPGLPVFATANAFPMSRIRKEILFSVAQRVGELTTVDAPLLDDWINDAYTQVLGMIENTRTTFSDSFTLPAATSLVAFPAVVDQIFSMRTVDPVEGIYTLQKVVDIEFWRSTDVNTAVDTMLFSRYFVQRDNVGLLVQFYPQSTAAVIEIDGMVRPPRLAGDADCPILDEALCLGMVDLAISIALRRLGEYTYSGTQNNAALGIIRSHIDSRAQSRRGTVAAVTRPRTLEEARRKRGT